MVQKLIVDHIFKMTPHLSCKHDVTLSRKSCKWSLLSARWFQFTISYPSSPSSVLTSSSILRLRIPNILFSYGFLPKTMYALLNCLMHATCLANPKLHDLITLTIRRRKQIMKLCIMKFSLVPLFYSS